MSDQRLRELERIFIEEGTFENQIEQPLVFCVPCSDKLMNNWNDHSVEDIRSWRTVLNAFVRTGFKR